jgi:hypothetical protein
VNEPSPHQPIDDEPVTASGELRADELERLCRQLAGLRGRLVRIESRTRNATQELRWLRARARALERELERS